MSRSFVTSKLCQLSRDKLKNWLVCQNERTTGEMRRVSNAYSDAFNLNIVSLLCLVTRRTVPMRREKPREDKPLRKTESPKGNVVHKAQKHDQQNQLDASAQIEALNEHPPNIICPGIPLLLREQQKQAASLRVGVQLRDAHVQDEAIQHGERGIAECINEQNERKMRMGRTRPVKRISLALKTRSYLWRSPSYSTSATPAWSGDCGSAACVHSIPSNDCTTMMTHMMKRPK
jgi:hypothetical protein